MNMKFAALSVLGTFSLMALAPQASAADNGFYLGAGLTQTKFDADDLDEDFKLDDNSFKVIAGFRPLDWLAVEANYIDLGSDSNGGATIDSDAITASVLLIKEFQVVDFYARAGLAKWNVDTSLGELSADDDGTEFTYGVGVGLHFGSLGVRAEYERFKIGGDFDTNVNTLSLSATYTFL
jgi:outer membrane protein with beta-barrel domain